MLNFFYKEIIFCNILQILISKLTLLGLKFNYFFPHNKIVFNNEVCFMTGNSKKYIHSYVHIFAKLYATHSKIAKKSANAVCSWGAYYSFFVSSKYVNC